eukprot:scaffold1019_cov255-Pinguiococcus_pyrenoidosus.AAC.5
MTSIPRLWARRLSSSLGSSRLVRTRRMSRLHISNSAPWGLVSSAVARWAQAGWAILSKAAPSSSHDSRHAPGSE